MNLTYNATSAEEFKSLCLWLRENGFTKGGATVLNKREETTVEKTYEEKWKARTGEIRMRLTGIESKRMLTENLTREDIAKERLAQLDISEGVQPEQQTESEGGETDFL